MEYSAAQSGASRGGGTGAGGQAAAAAATGNASRQQQPPSAFRSLVMGSAPGQMGLGELRSRAAELRRTLDELARVLASRPEALLWRDVLEKFGVAGVQAGALAAACGRRAPLAAAYAAHPCSVSALNAAALPVMLSTAPLPEAVAERARRVAEAVEAVTKRAAAAKSAGGGEGMEIDNEEEEEEDCEDEEALERRLAAAAESVNALVDSLTAAPSAPLDAKSRERRALAAEAHALAAPPPPPPPRGSNNSRPLAARGGAGGGGGGAAAAVQEDPKARLVSRALLGRLV